MSFVPHMDSDRSELKANSNNGPSEKKFVTKMESENIVGGMGGKIIAIIVAFIVSAAFGAVTVMIVIPFIAIIHYGYDETLNNILLGVAAIASIIVFFFTIWFMLEVLQPGNVV